MLRTLTHYNCIRFAALVVLLATLGAWLTFHTYSRNRTLAAISADRPAKATEAARLTRSDVYGKLPLSFELNRGQADERVKFQSRGSGYSLFLTSTEALMLLRKNESSRPSGIADSEATLPQKMSVVRTRLLGANPSAQIAGEDELPGKSNYFIGNDANKWRTDVPNYQAVRFHDIYPGIDLVYHGNQRLLEYDFVVAPRANPRLIRLEVAGARRLRVDRHGDLVLRTNAGQMRQLKPVIYQDIDGQRRMVTGGYAVRHGHLVTFKIGNYDHKQPLLIDPTLVYSTYLGGGDNDYGEAITADNSGNAYVVGYAF